MKDSFYRSMNWLHTWAGLLVCWVLLLIFFAGSLSFFRHEISLYAKPELHANVITSAPPADLAATVQHAQQFLSTKAPHAPDWLIEFPSARQPYLSYSWSEKIDGQRRPKFHSQPIDHNGNEAERPRDTLGGNFFYRLHFDLHYLPVQPARYLVGICTMFMLIALISGIIIHKRIFKDFFSFRGGKGSRSWLDAHNISAVFALPFHLVITYTGLITLMFMYMPWAGLSIWKGDADAMFDEMLPRFTQPSPSGQAAPMLDVHTLLPRVQQLWGDEAQIHDIRIRNPGDSQATVSFNRDTGQQITDETTQLVFSAVDGTLLYQSPDNHSAAVAVHDTLMALHTARFAGPALRSLGFVMGLLGCAMIASGCLLWALRLREKRRQGFGLSLVEGLNLTMIVGLPLGTVLFFLANRLLPEALAGRPNLEVAAFFAGIALCALTATVRRDSRAWRALLGLTGLLALALPLINALSTPANIFSNLQHGQWSLAIADLLFIATAAACWFARHHLPKGVPEPRKPLREQTA
ncbi:PepSY domain-containing protein [Shewanella sp. JM162201]|uniref:PepSY domain-containing protein n=1 Tax=Shewanella jiangmenensis TaxID=2837387 RepID=A0ABS5V4B4_9GAMM|nr:PepSY-associated TM helix domain-containing protein [Shewanella jiangmenensis]MBT1445275.1 PepSY domain-containing protein [Shewanella jiangmenensis]